MFINYDDLRLFAYSNDMLIKGNPRAIAVSFFGLGGQDMYNEDTHEGRFFADKKIIYAIPYTNPWAWMNKRAVELTDSIISSLRGKYGDIPVISTGGSMGGLAALVYTVYAAVTPVACVANCPVCDLPYHYTERDDLPRTLCSAFDPDRLKEELEEHSPLHLVQQLPDIDYYIFHCRDDLAVNKQMHSDRLVAKISGTRKVCYYEIPGRGHCDLGPAWQKYMECICTAADKYGK